MKYPLTLNRKKVLPLEGPYIEYQNKKMLDFSSLDILGLGQHPDIKKNAIKYTLKLGTKTLSSPLNSIMQVQVEDKLAQMLSVEKCHLFDSKKEVLYSLSRAFEDSSIFSDEPYSFFPQATLFENIFSLKALLNKKPSVVITKTSYPHLKELYALAQENNALICLNHSDTFGIVGKRGLGFLPQERKNVILFGSFQRVGGFSTGYIGSSYLFYQDHSLPPSILGAIDALLNLSPDMDQEREHIGNHVSWLHKLLEERGFTHFTSQFPTTILTLSSEEEAEKLWNTFCVENIFLGNPSPTQISLTMTALHTPDDLDQLSCVFKKLSATDFALVTQSLTPTP